MAGFLLSITDMTISALRSAPVNDSASFARADLPIRCGGRLTRFKKESQNCHRTTGSFSHARHLMASGEIFQERGMFEIRGGAAAAFALFTLAACSSDPAPRQDLGSAEQAVSQARAQEAPQYAPKAYGKAHGKLAQAQAALKKGDHARARRLADEASVDAELAQATAESAKNRAELDELQRSIKALKSQVHAMAAQPTTRTPVPLSNATQ